MLFYKLFSNLMNIDGAMNFLSRRAALKGLVFFPTQKITCLLNRATFGKKKLYLK